MPLVDYKGPANSSTVFRHLVGERIAAAFVDPQGHKIIIFDSGEGMCFSSNGSYWPIAREECERMIREKQNELQAKIAELGDFNRMAKGVELENASSPARFDRDDPV